MRKKYLGIVGMVMLLLLLMVIYVSPSDATDSRYAASNWQSYADKTASSELGFTLNPDKIGDNCFGFASLVVRHMNNVEVRGYTNDYRVLNSSWISGIGSLAGKGSSEVWTIVGQCLGDGSYISTEDVRAAFSKAKIGDWIQMVRKGSNGTSQHSAIISELYENGFEVVHSNWIEGEIINTDFTYESFAQQCRNAGYINGYNGGFTINHFAEAMPDLPWDGSTVLLNRGDFPIKVYTLENRTYDVYSDKYLRNKLTSNWTDGSEEDWILDVGKNSEGVDYAYISIPLNNGNRKNVYVNLRDVFVKGSLNEPTHVYKDCRDFYRRRGSDYDSSYVLIADDATIFPLTRDNGWVQVCFWDWGENGGARIAWLTAREYTRIITDDSVTPPTITTSSLPDAYIGKSYSATLTATGTTPITYECNGATAMSYGFLLDGKNFAYTSTNGLINGTITNPTSHSTPFTVDIHVTASNGGGSYAKTLPVTLYNLPSISYTFKDSKTGLSYSDYVTVSGGKSPYTWTKQSGSFPDGLSMSSSGSNLFLNGTPTKAGTYNFSLKVKDVNGKTATKSFTITITPSATAPSITTTSLPDGGVGLPDGRVSEPYSVTLSATGTTPITWSATGLPSGLSCSSSGTISGTPTTSVTLSVTVTATNTAGSTSKTLILTIMRSVTAPSITTTSLPQGRVGTAYSATLSATGTGITWSATGLPSGLSCSSSGTISGTPTASGTFSVTVTATNAAGSMSSAPISLTIASVGSDIITPEVEDEVEPEFKAHQPVLKGMIIVNFFALLPEIYGVNYENSYVKFNVLNDTKYNPEQEYDPSFTTIGKSGTYYGFKCCLTSVQMADPITATLHYGNGRTVKHTYKLTDYLDDYYSASTTPEALKNIVGAMKDYGHYAQIALAEVNGWELGKDHLPTEAANVYTNSDIEEARQAVENYAKSWNVGTSGIKSIGYRLVLDSDTAIDLFLRPASGYSGKVCAYSRGAIGITDTSANLAVKQPDGRYLVQISGIPAHKLDYMNTIRVVTDNGEFDIKVSALSYVNTVINSDNDNDNMKKAVTSLYRYYKATKEYRESTGQK